MPDKTISFKAALNTKDMEAAGRRLQNLFTGKPFKIDDGGSLRKISTGADAATQDIKELSDAAKRAEADVKRLGSGGSALGGLGSGLQSALIGGAAGFLTIQGARQAAEFAASLSTVAAEARRADVALVALSGGEQQAAAALAAVKSASGGTVTDLEASRIATQALSLELARTPAEFDKLVKSARVTALISPVIHDVSSAISELGLAAANLSFRRLDQLGLSTTEVKDRMKDLQAANGDLSDSQAFLIASQDALLAKGGELINSQAAQATGVEELRVAFSNLGATVAEVVDGPINALSAALADLTRDATVTLGGGGIGDVIDSLRSKAGTERGLAGVLTPNLPNDIGGNALAQQADDAALALQQIIDLESRGIQVSDEFKAATLDLARNIQRASVATDENATALDNAFGSLELYANGGIKVAEANDQAAASGDGLKYSLETVGAATEGAGAGMVAMANVAYSMALAMDNASLSAQGLGAEMQRLGQLKATIEAATAPINAAAARGRSQAISAGTNIASIVGPAVAQQLTEAAVGALEAGFDQLKAPLLTGTGGAPSDIELAFAQQQITDEALGTISDIRANEDARIAAEKKAQQDAERSAKKVASAQEKAAKDMARTLENGLRNVPGLFGTTQVTQEDFALQKLGLRTDTADEYLRRLRDEVRNGVDYADVSLEQAKQALERVGANIGDGSAEAIITAMERAWRDSSLFSDPQNIADLVNTDAVQNSLEQAQKAEEGKKNLLKFFGISDVEAAAAGIGSSTAGVIKDEIVAADIGSAITESMGAGGVAAGAAGLATDGVAATGLASVKITPQFDFDLSSVDLTQFAGLGDKIAESITLSETALSGAVGLGGSLAAQVYTGFYLWPTTNVDIDYMQRFVIEMDKSAKNAWPAIGQDGEGAAQAFADGFQLWATNHPDYDYMANFQTEIGSDAAAQGGLFWIYGGGAAQNFANGFTEWAALHPDIDYSAGLVSGIASSLALNVTGVQENGGILASAVVSGYQNFFGSEEGKGVDLAAPIVQRLFTNVNTEANKKAAEAAGKVLVTSVHAGFVAEGTKADWITEIIDYISSQALDAVSGAAEGAATP